MIYIYARYTNQDKEISSVCPIRCKVKNNNTACSIPLRQCVSYFKGIFLENIKDWQARAEAWSLDID